MYPLEDDHIDDEVAEEVGTTVLTGGTAYPLEDELAEVLNGVDG